jgi:hypothetical protein
MRELKRSTYRELVTDWVLAEIASPAYANRYLHLGADLVCRAQSRDVDDIRPAEMDHLIAALYSYRAGVIPRSHINPDAKMYRTSVSMTKLAEFQLIPYFACKYRLMSFGELAKRIRTNPVDPEGPMRDEALAIQRELPIKGMNGTPIAIADREGGPYLLVEGYKRSMAALWAGWTEINLFLSVPGEIAG